MNLMEKDEVRIRWKEVSCSPRFMNRYTVVYVCADPSILEHTTQTATRPSKDIIKMPESGKVKCVVL